MRVLLVTKVFPPAIGGPATFGARLGEELVQKGHTVKVVCGTKDSDISNNYPFPVIRTGFSGNIIKRELSFRMHLIKSMMTSDIVYCMGLEHQTVWACRVTRKPFVLRIGGDSVWEGARNLGITNLEPEAFFKETSQNERQEIQVPEQRRLVQLKSARVVVYVSNYLKQLAIAWSSYHPVNEHVILNGISTNEKPGVLERKEGEPMRLLFVGRQTNWKGVDAILLALSQIENVKLTIAGSGPMLPANIDLSRRLGLENKVEFLGHVDPRAVDDLMAYHHVLILPSLYEGLSNTLLEAGAAGIACISSDRGGNPEVIIHNQTGYLVDPFCIKDITRAIKSLCDNDTERVRLAENHRDRVMTEFTMKQSLAKTAQVLENAINLQ